MKQLVLAGVTKTFGKSGRTATALDSVGFTVEPGEFFVLLGPSGCGKSTLLNSIAGLEKPDSGSIALGEREFFNAARHRSLSPRERNVAMVFQSYALYPHMSVAQNIGFPLRVRRTGKEELQRKVAAAAAMLQIGHLLAARPAELSGGQRQRVAIARALVREPDLFLLDEPLSNLDAQLRSAMRGSLKELQNRLRITTLYVTHDQVEAMTLGDRIAVLRAGAVEQIGTPEELYSEPANAFVASFIGAPPMNLVAARCRRSGSSVILRSGGMEYICRSEHVRISQSVNDQPVLLGIRPEHISLCGSDAPGAFAVTVTGCEKIGRETVVFARRQNSSLVLIAAASSPAIGSTLHVRFPDDAVYCFDGSAPQSGTD